jgi:hypothetical protein
METRAERGGSIRRRLRYRMQRPKETAAFPKKPLLRRRYTLITEEVLFKQ